MSARRRMTGRSSRAQEHDQSGSPYGPSPAAADAYRQRLHDAPGDEGYADTEAAALAAMHDPVLGLDRSVCLRDVHEFVGEYEAVFEHPPSADVIAEHFGVTFRGDNAS